MEKFTKINWVDGNYAYNTIGETFYVTNDLLPLPDQCIISYNPEWTSTITRSEVMEDSGEELFYDSIVRHVDKVFASTEELAEYRRVKWIRDNTLEIALIEIVLGETDFSELVA